jgi:hypothetical protein
MQETENILYCISRPGMTWIDDAMVCHRDLYAGTVYGGANFAPELFSVRPFDL